MKRFALAAAAALLLAAGPAAADTRLTLKSAKAGTSYYVMMVQLSELLKKESGGKILPTVEESQGSVQNVKEAAKRPGAFLFTTPPGLIHQGLNGQKPFEGETGFDRIRGLFVMPFITVHAVVSADSGITAIDGLAGHKFIGGGKGTFCEQQMSRMFDVLGLTGKVEVVDVELNQASAALRNKRVSGFATCSSHPTPQVVELASAVPLRILSLSADVRAKLNAADPNAGPITIAPGTYKGQDAAVDTVGLAVGAYGTTEMDEETAYFVTRTFWRQREELAKAQPWWAGVTPALVPQLQVKMHPGALRYYKEAGVAIPGAMM